MDIRKEQVLEMTTLRFMDYEVEFPDQFDLMALGPAGEEFCIFYDNQYKEGEQGDGYEKVDSYPTGYMLRRGPLYFMCFCGDGIAEGRVKDIRHLNVLLKITETEFQKSRVSLDAYRGVAEYIDKPA